MTGAYSSCMPWIMDLNVLFHMIKKCIVLVLLNLETDMILFPGHNWPMLWKYKA